MLVFTHVIIAISGLVYTGYLNLFPDKSKFTPAYWLVGGTVASGIALGISKPAHMLSICLSGLVYLGIAACGLLVANYRASKKEL